MSYLDFKKTKDAARALRKAAEYAPYQGVIAHRHLDTIANKFYLENQAALVETQEEQARLKAKRNAKIQSYWAARKQWHSLKNNLAQ